MAKQHFADQLAFDPEAMTVLTQAIEQTCRALDIPPDDRDHREVIAARIADLARAGVVDADALRDRVLLESRATL